MATYIRTVEVGHLATPDVREALTREVRRGLTARPRSLSPWMFYDAEGSRLFEQITTLSAYYPTRTERAILSRHADAMVAKAHGAAIHGDRSLPLSWVPAPPRKPVFCLKLLCAFRTMSRTCRLMSAATLSSRRAKTLHLRCRKCAYSPSSGTT